MRIVFALQVDITDNWRRVLFPILAFVVAWLLVKFSRVLINRLALKIERRRLPSDGDLADTAALRSIKRHDTTVSLVGTTVRYLIFTIAMLVALTQIIGPGKSAAIASASLLIIIVGFAAQRFLTDIMAGTFMFFEGWFEVGDTITVEPLDLTGVVEEVSLRSTKLRAVTGETLRVHNSQILATRALPRGVRDVEVELFVSDEAAGRELVDDVAAIVPVGPTRFVSRPQVDDSRAAGRRPDPPQRGMHRGLRPRLAGRRLPPAAPAGARAGRPDRPRPGRDVRRRERHAPLRAVAARHGQVGSTVSMAAATMS